MYGVGHAGFGLQPVADGAARIFDSVGDDRPAVIDTGGRNIDLVAAARAVFDGPEPAGLRVDGRALNIAVTVGPYLRQRTRFADERIVRRDATLRCQADDLADMTAQFLGVVACAAVASGQEDVSVGGKDDT